MSWSPKVLPPAIAISASRLVLNWRTTELLSSTSTISRISPNLIKIIWRIENIFTNNFLGITSQQWVHNYYMPLESVNNGLLVVCFKACNLEFGRTSVNAGSKGSGWPSATTSWKGLRMGSFCTWIISLDIDFKAALFKSSQTSNSILLCWLFIIKDKCALYKHN